MKTEREVREEIRRIRERVRGLSGFWIGEASEAIYALEWALGKRDPSPFRGPRPGAGRPGEDRRFAAKLAPKARRKPRRGRRGMLRRRRRPPQPAPAFESEAMSESKSFSAAATAAAGDGLEEDEAARRLDDGAESR